MPKLNPKHATGMLQTGAMVPVSITKGQVFTTGEVAQICQVAPRTVSKWFDKGLLTGYRIPCSRDRRIPFDNLQQFMSENGIPLDRLLDTFIRVMLYGNSAIELNLSEEVTAINDISIYRRTGYQYEISQNRLTNYQGSIKFCEVSTSFDAGIHFHSFVPSIVIFDGKLDTSEIQSCFAAIEHHKIPTYTIFIDYGSQELATKHPFNKVMSIEMAKAELQDLILAVGILQYLKKTTKNRVGELNT